VFLLLLLDMVDTVVLDFIAVLILVDLAVAAVH
jgi:hypothetical protein